MFRLTASLNLLKRKNKQRTKATKSGSITHHNKFSQLRREAKAMAGHKKKFYVLKLQESLYTNPKRFWSYVKTKTKEKQVPNFLRDGQRFVSNTKDRIITKLFLSISV